MHRWGDSRSPAFGELTDYHLFLHIRESRPEVLRTLWGEELNSPDDIAKAFCRYLNGDIDQLPWIDGPLSPETDIIKSKLLTCVLPISFCQFFTFLINQSHLQHEYTRFVDYQLPTTC